MSRLVFKAPAALSGRLVFGLSNGPAAPANATLHVGGALGDMGGVVWVAEAPARVAVAGALGDMMGSCTVVYASNTSRPAVCAVAVAWQDARPAQASLVDTWQDAQRRRASAHVAWQRARGASAQTRSSWQDAAHARAPLGVAFERADRLASLLASSFASAERVRSQVRSLFEQAHPAGSALQGQFANTLRLREASRLHFEAAIRQSAGVLDWAIDALRAGALLRGVFQQAIHAPAGLYIPPPIIPAGTCYVPSARLVFAEPAPEGVAPRLVFVCERHGPPPEPQPGGTVVVPIQRIYMVFNDAMLRRVDGNISLPADSFALNLDMDSWAWGFSCSLPGRVLPDLEPADNGAPVELEAMVNGQAFRVLVESISRERTFGKNDIRVQGRGKTALLDSPYAPVRNFGNSAARTAQQLMADVLSLNGVSMGWDIDWKLTDWLVPAGVFAHQGSYISALNTIAAAAGGYVQPHASLQTLQVLARYPVAPWQWGTVTPDFELPADVTEREGIEWVERARYNRVFVSGQQSGILGQVTRAGTAGDLLAPMVTDALITHADAARQRGTSVLGNTGRQANVSLRLPVLAETGVITPGRFVRYVDAGATRLGVVRSVSLDVNFPDIWQSIGVETHV